MEALIVNRHAKRDYVILEQMEAGIVLTGREVKSVRLKRATINEAFVRIMSGEAFLVNANIQPYQNVQHIAYDPTHSRKLLLKKRQIKELEEMLHTKGLTAMPLMIGVSKHFIKVLVGVGKGKKQYERRDELKKRDIKRETDKVLKKIR